MIRQTLLISLAASALLAGCMGAPAEGLGPVPLTPTQRFTLQVEPGIERIALAVHDTGLSANQQNAVLDVARRFGQEGAASIIIEAPSGQDVVASELAWRVKGLLEQMGIPAHQLQVVAYNAPDPRAPVLVGYESLRARVPQCGRAWGSLTRTANNESSANFGCAVTANLAAQIADPRDIIAPRTMTPVDGARRSVVIDKYRKGEPTAAVREELLTNQQVSNAVE
ncbi:MAG: pilus assembly protein CpaD [Alphaproteobacteria bacterium]|nr:MAG: pilus assembly protein CpaD [Alphaproteobacteria bacterium]PZO38555.1 MAG: pilus assembly protein CpaD [Alphaproteobacteria bacterium]